MDAFPTFLHVADKHVFDEAGPRDRLRLLPGVRADERYGDEGITRVGAGS
jgi:hypothetical protein